jgi:hypothetical protein
MVLHTAIKLGYSDIVQQLLDVCPDEVLHTENGFGETPLEMAISYELRTRTASKYLTGPPTPSILSLDGALATQERFDVTKQEVEIAKLRATLDQLLQDGRLKKGTKTATELLAFAVSMEAKLATAKARAIPQIEEKSEDSDKIEKAEADPVKTLDLIRKAVLERPGVRQLVHLVDVQKLVEGNLHSTYKATERFRTVYAQLDELGKSEEVGDLQKQKSRSIVFSFIGHVV